MYNSVIYSLQFIEPSQLCHELQCSRSLCAFVCSATDPTSLPLDKCALESASQIENRAYLERRGGLVYNAEDCDVNCGSCS